MSGKKNALIGGVLLILLVAGFGWNSIIGKAASNAENLIIAKVNDNINGRLTVDHFGHSFVGTITAYQVTLYDKQNVVLGTSNKIVIDYGLFNLLSGNLDFHSIKNITLDSPSVLLTSKAGQWNWDDLLKSEAVQLFTFRGLIHVNKGILSINTPENRKLEVINGNIDFRKYPSLAFDMTGKSGNSPIGMKGSWNFSGDGTLDFTSEHIALTELPLDQILPSDFQISDGEVKNLILTFVRQSNKLTMFGEGSVENFAASVNGYNLSHGKAKFKLAEGKLNLLDTSLLVDGQNVILDGTLSYNNYCLTLNLNAASSAFDPAVLTGGSFQGPLSFDAQLLGTAVNPLLIGTFAISQGNFGVVTFSNANGNFTYTAGTMKVQNATAHAWDGTLSCNGNVIPVAQAYNLAVHGSNLDAGLLTDKEVKGRVDLDARISGQSTNDGNASGSFKMGEGSFSSIPCLSITGDFNKQGSPVAFSNVIVRTAAGSFHATGLSEGAVVTLQRIDTLPGSNTRDLLDQLKKLGH